MNQTVASRRRTRAALATALLLALSVSVVADLNDIPKAGSSYRGQLIAETIPATNTERLTELAKKDDAKTVYAVRGKVVEAATSGTGKVFRIRFENAAKREDFIAVYFPAMFDVMKERFGGDDGSGMNGKQIEVVGPLKWYQSRSGQGQPEIVIEHPDQVRLVEAE